MDSKDTPQIHRKFATLIRSIHFGTPESIQTTLEEFSIDEANLFFQTYDGLDMISDVKLFDAVVPILSTKRIVPKISGDGLIRSIKLENVDLLEMWCRITQNVNVQVVFFKDEKKDTIFSLFEKVLLKGSVKIAELLIDFFKTHKIDFKISEALCDELSKNDPSSLQELLNLAIKLDVNIESNPASLRRYPELSRKVWKSYYDLLLTPS